MCRLDLVGPGKVVMSVLGVFELAKGMIPVVLCLVFYALAILLYSFKPIISFMGKVPYKYLAATAGVFASGVVITLLAIGPKRPGSGAILAILTSAWAFKLGEFDNARSGGYAAVGRG